MFLHRNIPKYTRTSPDGKNHDQIDQILKDKEMAFEYTRCTKFQGTDFDTDHYLVVENVRENLAVNKQETQKFDGERFNLRKLNELEVRKQYQIKISNRFAALENLHYGKDINRAWQNIKENI